jgi:hypothetical protein
MSRSRSKKRSAAARSARERPERRQDPRLIAARAVGQDGVAFSEEMWVLGVSPARMADGRVLMWHSPQPVAFNLIEAMRFRDRGRKRRLAIMGNLEKRRDDNYGPRNSRAAIDCLRDLQAAVLSAFTAIESLANHAIDMLEDDATLMRKEERLSKDKLLRLGVSEKLKIVVPMAEGGRHVASDSVVWGRYRELKFLRDELVHVKSRGYESDPDEPTAYDRLMLGEADMCVEDARAVIDGAWPGFLLDHVTDALGDGLGR